MFLRARDAGLELDELRGVVSDGSRGLIEYMNRGFSWVNHQRCVFHLWRNLSVELRVAVKAATTGLSDEVSWKVSKTVRAELVSRAGAWDVRCPL